MTLSTHVLDLTRGTPADGLRVSLYRLAGGTRERIADGITGADGRVAKPFGGDLGAGEYELLFETGEYFMRADLRSFYAEIPVRFSLLGGEHYHVPLLLSPFGYSTYRGS